MFQNLTIGHHNRVFYLLAFIDTAIAVYRNLLQSKMDLN